MSESDPTDKVYLIHLIVSAGAESHTHLATDVERTQFMGIECLKGTLRPGKESHFMAGRVMYFPVDKIVFITEYDSHAAYQEAVKRHYEERSM